MKSFVVLAALALGGVLARADSGPLQWKFKTGDRFYQQTDLDLKQTITFQGQTADQNMEQSTVTQFTVQKATPDSVVLEQKILAVQTRGNIPGAVDDKLKGTIFTVTLNARHEITRFEGYDDFLKKASDGNDDARKLLAAVLSEDTFKQAVSEAFSFLPGKAAKLNETWDRGIKVSLGPVGDMAVKSTYRYAGKARADGRDLDKITYKSTMQWSPPRNQVQGLPFQVTKGTMKTEKFEGTILFDPEAGRLVESTVNMKLKGDLTFSIQGQEVDVELSQEQVIKARISDKEPQLKGRRSARR
jgi:hypothetical protein